MKRSVRDDFSTVAIGAKRAIYWLTFPFTVSIRWMFGLGPIEKLTAILCIIGGFQLYAFIHSERSFVYPTGAQFSPPLAIPGPSNQGIEIEMKNAGKGVAETEILVAAITHALPSTPVYQPTSTGQQQIVAFGPLPGGTTRTRTFPFETAWGENTTNGIKSGKVKLYLYGYINYHDGFSYFGPIQHGFCFVYVPSKSGFDTCLERAYTYTR